MTAYVLWLRLRLTSHSSNGSASRETSLAATNSRPKTYAPRRPPASHHERAGRGRDERAAAGSAGTTAAVLITGGLGAGLTILDLAIGFPVTLVHLGVAFAVLV